MNRMPVWLSEAWQYVVEEEGTQRITGLSIILIGLMATGALLVSYRLTGASWQGGLLGGCIGVLFIGVIHELARHIRAGTGLSKDAVSFVRPRLMFLFGVFGTAIVSIAWVLVILPSVLELVILGLFLMAGLFYVFPAAVVRQVHSSSWIAGLVPEPIWGIMREKEYRTRCVGTLTVLLFLWIIGVSLFWQLVSFILVYRPVSQSLVMSNGYMYTGSLLVLIWAPIMVLVIMISGWTWGQTVDEIMEGSSLH